MLDTIVATYLFKKFPDKQEGFLTQVRSKLVQRSQLGQLGLEMGLDKFITKQLGHNTLPMKHLCGTLLAPCRARQPEPYRSRGEQLQLRLYADGARHGQGDAL